MIVGNKLFIHIPKTGGTSLTKYLTNSPPSIFNGKHDKIIEINGDLSNLFIFTIVRNPYDRVASMYRYQKNGGYIPHNSYKEWLFDPVEMSSWFYDPQYTWIDHRVKVYKLEDGIDVILKALGIKDRGLHLNQSVKHDVNSDDECVEFVNRKYEKDFEIFGY